MLLGLTEPTSGTAWVSGYNATREPLKVKRIAGYLPENLGFYEDLTARENLSYIASLNIIPEKQAVERIEESLALVGLSGEIDRKVETFSKGMKQRLGIAGILIKAPRVAFLDEPTAGLDPEGARFVLDLIVKLSKEQGMTVLFSSHLLHQVQRVCHRVGILSRGRLVAEGPVESLEKEAFGTGQLKLEVELAGLDPHLIDSLQQIEGVASIERSGDNLLINSDRDVRAQVSTAILQSGSSLLQMKLRGHGLEEIYLKYFH
jgi:ABC-2 type transport system ATP-binding protein